MTGRRRQPPGVVSRQGREPPRAIRSRSAVEAALAYGMAGWAVLPVAGMSAGKCACRRPCGHPAKHPITRHGVHDATTDAVLIREWWHRSPAANVGIATGAASGLVVVDVDLPRGGRESLRALADSGHQLAPTLRSYTGGGGLHLFYAPAPGVGVPNAVGRLPGVAIPLPGIDVRSDGGYVVAPPSVHASGSRYRWDRRPIAPLPVWILPRPRATPSLSVAAHSPTTGASPYGAAALGRELEIVRALVVGQRNDGLNRSAFSLGRLVGGGELPETLVYEALITAAMATGLGHSEADRTIRSGVKAGRTVPRRAASRPGQRFKG